MIIKCVICDGSGVFKLWYKILRSGKVDMRKKVAKRLCPCCVGEGEFNVEK